MSADKKLTGWVEVSFSVPVALNQMSCFEFRYKMCQWSEAVIFLM